VDREYELRSEEEPRMRPAVDFRLLGPLEIVSGGRPLPLPPRKQRALLAILLLRANQPVPVQELSEKLWDHGAPADPRGAVQKYVMRLRRALRPTGCVIHTEPEGYRLELLPGMLDADRFTELVEHGVRLTGAGQLEAASAALAAALDLWRAVPPMSNVVSEVLQRDEVPRLVERYLQAVERRIDLDLQLGRSAELCAELLRLTSDYPLRERFWVQRMRALYAANRQGEALEAYRTVTRLLAEDLGIDPGPELREAHQQILNGRQQTASGVKPSWPGAPPARQLPMATSGIVGRRAEMAEIVNVLQAEPRSRGSRLVVVTGPEGVGKTSVAVQAAHRLANAFPDGQLFVDLGGGAEVDGADLDGVLAYLLRTLGVRTASLPTRRNDAIATYRSLTAGQRLLVVLDGATSGSLVRSLLPGSATCAVLVTSRHDLADLLVSPGGHRLALGMLAPEDAGEVLRDIVGDHRVRTEPHSAARLIARCGGLPLAVRVAAVHLATRPDLTIASYLDELEKDDVVETRRADLRGRSPAVDAVELCCRYGGNRAG
jgi:DNA-binding SARP family transcriptional activator